MTTVTAVFSSDVLTIDPASVAASIESQIRESSSND